MANSSEEAFREAIETEQQRQDQERARVQAAAENFWGKKYRKAVEAAFFSPYAEVYRKAAGLPWVSEDPWALPDSLPKPPAQAARLPFGVAHVHPAPGALVSVHPSVCGCGEIATRFREGEPGRCSVCDGQKPIAKPPPATHCGCGAELMGRRVGQYKCGDCFSRYFSDNITGGTLDERIADAQPPEPVAKPGAWTAWETPTWDG